MAWARPIFKNESTVLYRQTLLSIQAKEEFYQCHFNSIHGRRCLRDGCIGDRTFRV